MVGSKSRYSTSSAIVFTFASVYSPFWVAIAGGLGATIGELVGYIAGVSGRRVVEASSRRKQLRNGLNKYGMLTVFVLAFLPLPLFDLIGVMAGALRMHLLQFIVPAMAGKSLKMLIYA
jgi:membrane protein YqaA with SNARE-associated domain